MDTNMSKPQTPDMSFSPLDNLPPEILNNILGELLDISKSPRTTTVDGNKPWATMVTPISTLDPAILCINKGFYAMSKSLLDKANDWVVFDIDHVHLLLPLAQFQFPVVLADPEAPHALPEGIMHVRVSLRVSRSSFLAHRLDHTFPAAIPRRQFVLVPATHFEPFLRFLRMIELAHGMHALPGTFRLKLGFHGLRIRVTVNEKYDSKKHKTDRTQPLLDLFRMFHGPLNEVSITGASDAQHASLIEECINAPQVKFTFHESLLHAAEMTSKANKLVISGEWPLAHVYYHHAHAIVVNSVKYHNTPWTGGITDYGNLLQRPFETLLISITTKLNYYLGALQNQHNPVLQGGLHNTLTPVSEFHGTGQLHTMALPWLTLIGGLHNVFTIRREFDDDENRYSAYSTGFDMMAPGLNTALFAQVPVQDQALFHAAKAALERLDAVEEASEPDLNPLWEEADIQATFISDVLEAEKKPVRWMVHESIIPKALIEGGILDHMIKIADMTEEERGQCVVVDTFNCDEIDGDYYCI